MNDNTVCCQNRELTEPAGETACPYYHQSTCNMHRRGVTVCARSKGELTLKAFPSGEGGTVR